MFILHEILTNLKSEFATSRKGHERGSWFVYTILAILVPFTSSKTSNILRCLKALFGITGIGKKRFYTFMASPKLPWQRLWQMIDNPLTEVVWVYRQSRWVALYSTDLTLAAQQIIAY